MKLTTDQINQFKSEGVLIANNILKDSDLQPVIDEINDYVDRRANEFFNQKKISSTFADLPFETRISKIYAECKEIVNGLDIMDLRGESMHQFLSNSNLLDAVEGLIGPEISCNPIQHLRAKMPQGVDEIQKGLQGSVPWHQDAGVTSEDADHTNIVTCWIPLVSATKEMGCMEIIPNGWKNGYLEHVSNPDYGTSIRPDLLPEYNHLCAECPKGGVVFMNKLIPHRGLPNNSNIVRWNIDLRFHKIGTPSGRSFYPDFPVRSKTDDLQTSKDHSIWSKKWVEALENRQDKKIHPRAVKETNVN